MEGWRHPVGRCAHVGVTCAFCCVSFLDHSEWSWPPSEECTGVFFVGGSWRSAWDQSRVLHAPRISASLQESLGVAESLPIPTPCPWSSQMGGQRGLGKRWLPTILGILLNTVASKVGTQLLGKVCGTGSRCARSEGI